ncbi:signal peptidase II [Labedaea rhizosphaerae]|uniref:Lipoprotein signal peptidase n=1 Tax=Labedaea rhizosphaerae TaxID=598644 RepID=A0A4R6SCD9_LABRH|nr:signal peptidase II [Labedaea rhizosphaerae]
MRFNGPVSSDQTADETTAEAAAVPAAEPVTALPRRTWPYLLVAAAFVLVLDIVSKLVVVAQLQGEEPKPILGGLVYLQLLRNSGAAFGIATGMTWILSLIVIAVIVAIIWIVPRLRSIGWAIGLGFVLAGALGNLSDRIFRAPGPLRGHVVDWISVFKPNGAAFAVFNLADSGICVGGALIVLMALLGKEYDGRTGKQDSKQNTSKQVAGE